jgi:putative Mg2+ transporter-C (MgtC) family protein
MDAAFARVAVNLGCALVAGALIGAERSYNGRAAGFRTMALVSLASAGAMSITLEPQFIAGVAGPTGAYLDPTRIGQGVMTGVGFLGGGVIFKEGVSVQGLTTAACIWATAALGMLFGLGMLTPAAVMTFIILVTLMGMRTLEEVLPRKVYALANFVFETARAPNEPELVALLGQHDVTLYDVSYGLSADGGRFEFRANLRTTNAGSLQRLAERLKETPGLVEFDLAKLSR